MYIKKRKKQRDYTFIPTSLFRDYSLIRGFYSQEYSQPSFTYFINLHNRRGGRLICFVQLSRSNALFLWLHEDTSSLHSLSDDNSGRQMIINFSLRQSLHLLLALL